jgi:putative transposase
MRRARLTYPGAFHHVMNRGIRGEYIFPDDADKRIFLEFLAEKAKILGVHLIGYCVMNNHYHVLLENNSGRMSALLKVVNGSYGIYYRRKHGGQG